MRKRGTAARLRSYIEIVRSTQRNVKRWQDGDMRKRWTAAGMLEAEQQFRRIIGYRDLASSSSRSSVTPFSPPRKTSVSGGRRARYRLTVNPEDRRRSSTTIRTSSRSTGAAAIDVAVGVAQRSSGVSGKANLSLCAPPGLADGLALKELRYVVSTIRPAAALAGIRLGPPVPRPPQRHGRFGKWPMSGGSLARRAHGRLGEAEALLPEQNFIEHSRVSGFRGLRARS